MSRFEIHSPQVPEVVVPKELADEHVVKEARRLTDEANEAAAELRELAAQESAAAEADREALAGAMAAGRGDPGDKNLNALATRIEAQQRKVTGLFDAATAAHARAHETV